MLRAGTSSVLFAAWLGMAATRRAAMPRDISLSDKNNVVKHNDNKKRKGK